jgi:7,8-dihydropterin-6-yl-methyl-4-(beta-D-ribofuranosyl)aminobenzene 5'-phosphate synthase
MKLCAALFFAAALGGVAAAVAPATTAAAEPNSQITILYDAFGTDAAMKKDWGFSALVEVAGKTNLVRHRQRCRYLRSQRQGEGY